MHNSSGAINQADAMPPVKERPSIERATEALNRREDIAILLMQWRFQLLFLDQNCNLDETKRAGLARLG